MKILLVSPYFLPKIGGLENYVYNLARLYQNTYGYEVVVVTANHKGNKRAEDNYKGLRVIRLPILFRLSNTPVHPLWYFMLKKIIRHEKPDLVNAHSPVPYIADMALLAAGKIPTILTYHSGSMKKSNGLVDTVLGIYENVFLPLLLRRATAIATVYPGFVKSKLPASKHSKLFSAPPGIDASVFRPAQKPNQKDATHLLYVGQIKHAYAWKGVDVAIKALAEAVKTSPDLTLTLVGAYDGVMDDHTRLAERLGVGDKVSFTGPLKGQYLARAYQKASILLVPSTSDAEAFGTVTIESLACGTPVIASRIGGVPAVIEATAGGLLVTPGDPFELSQTILKLATDTTLRKKLVESGQKSVEKSFRWETIVATYVEHIKELTSSHHKPAIFQLTPYFPPHLGGMENVVQEIAEELALRNYDVTVITSNVSFRPGFHDKPALVGKVRRLRTLEVAHLPILWALPFTLLRIPRGSILHVHIAQAFIPEIALLFAKLKHATFIAHFHLDVSASGTFGFIFKTYKKTLFPLMLRGAHKVIVFSEEQRQLVINKYGVLPSRVNIIPNGVRTEDYAIKRSLTTNTKRLLYVGRLSPQKRVDRLIGAMSHLPDSFHLDIVGAGQSQPTLEALVRELGLKSVTFRGPLFGDELIETYKQASVFVLPSDREGMPLVLLEAMAAGLPIVASDVIGNHELVHGVGMLVANPYEPRQFAKAIEVSLSLQQQRKLSAQSLRKAQSFSWKVLVNQLEALYDEAHV